MEAKKLPAAQDFISAHIYNKLTLTQQGPHSIHNMPVGLLFYQAIDLKRVMLLNQINQLASC